MPLKRHRPRVGNFITDFTVRIAIYIPHLPTIYTRRLPTSQVIGVLERRPGINEEWDTFFGCTRGWDVTAPDGAEGQCEEVVLTTNERCE